MPLFTPPYQPPVNNYLLALRTALEQTFHANPIIQSNTDDDIARNARVMTIYSTVTTMFQQRSRKAIIRATIELPDLTDDEGLSDLQQDLLNVPEWTTDTSDQ